MSGTLWHKTRIQRGIGIPRIPANAAHAPNWMIGRVPAVLCATSHQIAQFGVDMNAAAIARTSHRAHHLAVGNLLIQSKVGLCRKVRIIRIKGVRMISNITFDDNQIAPFVVKVINKDMSRLYC